jgi:SAM-dependent methyltransferase
VDADERAVDAARRLAARLAPDAPGDRFAVAPVEAMPFADASFDVVILSAVLHFARDPAHWAAMTDEAWRVLRPGGLWFARLASDVGLEGRVRPLGDGRFALPDGTERFLVDEALLVAETARLGGTLLDPLKTTVVQGMRAMTTWVARRDTEPAPTPGG